MDINDFVTRFFELQAQKNDYLERIAIALEASVMGEAAGATGIQLAHASREHEAQNEQADQASKPKRTRRTKAEMEAERAAKEASEQAATAPAAQPPAMPAPSSMPPIPGAGMMPPIPGAPAAAPVQQAPNPFAPPPAPVPPVQQAPNPFGAPTAPVDPLQGELAQYANLSPEQQFTVLLDAFTPWANQAVLRDTLLQTCNEIGLSQPFSDASNYAKPAANYLAQSPANRVTLYANIRRAIDQLSSQGR